MNEQEKKREANIERLMSGISDKPSGDKDVAAGKDANEGGTKTEPSDEENIHKGKVVEDKAGAEDDVKEPTEDHPEEEQHGEEREGIAPDATKVDAHAERMDRMEKMLQEMHGHIKSQNRSPEQKAYAEAYPHLADRHQEMVDRATKFADDTVGKDHADWHKIADGYLRNISDAEKKPEAGAQVSASVKAPQGTPKEDQVSGSAKKPVGTSPISKPAPKANAKGKISDEDKIDLLMKGR